MQIRHASGDGWHGDPVSKRRKLLAAIAAKGGEMAIGVSSSSRYFGPQSSGGGHSVGVVETRSKARAVAPSEQLGQVAEIVSWNRDTGVSEVVIGGDTTNMPTDGRAFFGRKMVGEIISRRIQFGEYDRYRGVTMPDKLILKVRSEFCPSVGARLRLYVEPRPTVTRPGRVW